jgi:hypothetical protein
MRSTPKILLALFVFVAALGGGLLLLAQPSGEPDAAPGKPAKQAGGDKQPISTVTSDIWKVGDRWTIKVRQDAGAITPGGETSIAEVPYRFEVRKAPADATGSWLVHVSQDGAEGPFAAGWNLRYVDKDGTMVLHQVSVGAEPPLEAELATIVLGPQFPYEVSYDAPPTAATIDATRLAERAELPPAQLPSGNASGAAPPAELPAPGGRAPQPPGS